MQTKTILCVITCIAFILTGCAAMDTAVSKRKLDVQTKQSETIFLDPVPIAQRTIYVQVKNTSDKPDFMIDAAVKDKLQDKGYTVVETLEEAHYLLQANILNVGKSDQRAVNHILSSGYGATAQGLLAGAAIGAYTSNGRHTVAGGMLGAAVSTVGNAMVKDIVYAVVTDVQIAERFDTWKRHQTRIVSSAERVNLKFETALPELQAGLVQAISGMF